MKINLAQLTSVLARGLSSFYWLSGDDPVLQDEALSRILTAVNQKGFHDKQHFTLSSQFDDENLWHAMHNRCLWQQKKIILVHLNAGKLTQKGAGHFLECLRLLHEDIVLIIQSSKLETNQYQTTWYKNSEPRGTVVQLWPLTEKEWQQWLNEQIKALPLTVDASGIRALTMYCDGNLLAAKNALQGLMLAYSQSTVTEKEVLALMTPQGDYNLNQLTDTILQGQGLKAERILQQLRQQGLEIILVLWAVLRELRLLTLLSDNPLPSDADLATYRLWPQRKTMLQQAAKRMPNHNWKMLFATAAQCDKIIKGATTGDPWMLLSQLVCSMSTQTNSLPLVSEI